MIEPTVAAIPGLLGAVAVEHAWLVRHADAKGIEAGRYDVADTLTSLSLGLASILAPTVAARVLAPLVPGRGRYGGALVGAAVGGAVVATAADLVRRSRPASPGPDGGPERGRRSFVDAAGASGALVAVSGGIIAGATTWATHTGSGRLWRRWGHRHDLGSGLLATVGAVLAWDLLYYANHRLMHSTRWLWAIHAVHHSSERYNLSTALRQPVAESLGAVVPYGVLSLLGFRPVLVSLARDVNLLYQFWIHTEAIGRLGPLERVLNTPSHHRVHHGSNRRYLDRNHGSILIVWDRLFGTFQAEDEPPVYGLTRPAPSTPLRAAVDEHAAMLRGVAAAGTWRARAVAVLGSPRGRRPGGRAGASRQGQLTPATS